jgi:hypothetical protein
MIEFDVDRTIADDADPGLSVAARFGTLEQYLGVLEEFVPLIQNQISVRTQARLKRMKDTINSADLHDELSESKWIIRSVVPNNFYGSFVVPLCAAIETSLSDILVYVLARSANGARPSNKTHQSAFDRLATQLECLLGEPPHATSSTLTAINHLHLARNILAHANGSLKGLRADRRTKVSALVHANVGVSIESEALTITPEFLRYTFIAAEAYISALLRQVAAKVPTP